MSPCLLAVTPHEFELKPFSHITVKLICFAPRMRGKSFPRKSASPGGFSAIPASTIIVVHTRSDAESPVLPPLAKIDSILLGDDRFHAKVCHFPTLGRFHPLLQARREGWTGGQMAELLMNSAIPSEGSMRASWPKLPNRRCANLALRPIPAKTPAGQQPCAAHQRRCMLGSSLKVRKPTKDSPRGSPWPQRKNLGTPPSVCHRPNGRRKETASRLPYPQDKQRTRAAERPFLLFTKTRTRFRNSLTTSNTDMVPTRYAFRRTRHRRLRAHRGW